MKLGIHNFLVPLGYLLVGNLVWLPFAPKNTVSWYPPLYGLFMAYIYCALYYHGLLIAGYVTKAEFKKTVLICVAILMTVWLLTGQIENMKLTVVPVLFLIWTWFLDKTIFRMK